MTKKAVDSTASSVPEIMDIQEAADFLKIKKWTLYRHAKDGVVPAKKIGGQWRFHRDVLRKQFQ
jgi:excisionase family DNA binding protein